MYKEIESVVIIHRRLILHFLSDDGRPCQGHLSLSPLPLSL